LSESLTIRELRSIAPTMLHIAMTGMFLITGLISVLALGGTFAAITYYDGWTERKQR
jgi:hypothetical protein